MATIEELEQRVNDLEALITVTDNPVEGDEYSFPVPNYPMDQKQFQLLSLVNGNGIIDRGDYPYWLEGWGTDAETNQKNSLRLRVGQKHNRAEAEVAGYFHVLNEDKTVLLPAVSSTTTYRVCLTYDSRQDDDRVGPVSVQVYTTEPPTTFDRINVTLYAVTREPNQLLTDAKVERFRPRTVAPIAVLRREHLPDPANVLFGSVAYIYGENDIVIARGASTEEGGPTRWDSMFAPDISLRGDSANYEWEGTGDPFRSTRVGTLVVLEGRIARAGGTQFYASNSDGYHIRTLPEGHRPRYSKRFITKADGFNDTRRDVVINIGSDGVVRAYPRQDCSWVSVDGIVYTVGV